MTFDAYQYLWPPRPEKAIPDNLLGYYEQKKWIAQVKKNGTCTVLYVQPDRRVIVKTRHKSDHKAWKPSKEFTDQFQELLPGAGWFVFAGELLHSKTPHIKDTIYLFDLLVDNGNYLVGETLQARLKRLHTLFPRKVKTISNSHYVVTPKLWVAETITRRFQERFNKLDLKEDEGLVLKDPTAKLNFCVKMDSNSASQVKCRKPTKNYIF